MFSLFKCIACLQGLYWLPTPLCLACQESLVTCPPLCPSCASPACGTPCLTPWRSELLAPLGIESFSAKYLAIGSGHRVLKRWKAQGGALLDRMILSEPPHYSGIDAVIPIPQSFDRAWNLRGGSSARVGRWVARGNKIPLIHGIRAMGAIDSTQIGHQAKRSLMGRIESKSQFLSTQSLPKSVRKVVLVDDFMTTGKTLFRAAEVLSASGVSEVHCFCLALRPRHLKL